MRYKYTKTFSRKGYTTYTGLVVQNGCYKLRW